MIVQYKEKELSVTTLINSVKMPEVTSDSESLLQQSPFIYLMLTFTGFGANSSKNIKL
jgi:hypothetical protein